MRSLRIGFVTEMMYGKKIRGSVVECGGRDAREPCIGDTAVGGRKYDLRPENLVRQTTAVSRQGLPPALHDAVATIALLVHSSEACRPQSRLAQAMGLSVSPL